MIVAIFPSQVLLINYSNWTVLLERAMIEIDMR